MNKPTVWFFYVNTDYYFLYAMYHLNTGDINISLFN